MPQVTQLRSAKRKAIAPAAIIMALLLVALGVLLFYQYQRHLASQEFNQLTAITDSLVAGNHTRQAADMWKNYAQNASNGKAYRTKAWQNAGLDYMSSQGYASALVCFQKAAAISGLNYPLATEIAQAAEAANNKPVAIQYYKESLKLIPSDTTALGEQKRLFESRISRLENNQ